MNKNKGPEKYYKKNINTNIKKEQFPPEKVNLVNVLKKESSSQNKKRNGSKVSA